MSLELDAPAVAEGNLSEGDLEKLTNEQMADSLGGPQSRQQPEASQSQPNAPTEEPTPEPVLSAPTGGQSDASDDEKTLLADIRAIKEVQGTTFKSFPDFLKSYKELQSTWTKDREIVNRVKPIEQLVNDLEDPNLRTFVTDAIQMYRNPQLAQAYQGVNGQADAPPDPRAYDIYDPDQKTAYDKAVADYMSRQLDGRISAKFSQQESQARLATEKATLKSLYPESDPDDVVRQIQERAKKGWTLADGYKVLHYDTLKEKIMADVRKELTGKLEQAGRTGSPASTGSQSQTVQLNDIVNYINQHGPEAAKKRFGEKIFKSALHDMAEMTMQ